MGQKLVVCMLAFFVLAGTAHAAMDSEEQAFLTLINNFRAQNGVRPLQASATLDTASQWMSNDMARKSYFSHTDSMGRSAQQRLVAFGYTYYPIGENLAAGYPDAASTFAQLRDACDPDSTGKCTYAHRKNMLNSGFKAIGIGRGYNATSRYRWYWTTDFGGVVDKPLNNTVTKTCYNSVKNMTATCSGGVKSSDTILSNGCRSVVCSTSGSVLQVLGCDRGTPPQYFELYKQTTAGNATLKACIGTTCISTNSYAKSGTYPVCV